MKDNSALLELIHSNTSFLLTAHIFPDGDNIGSLLALRAGLLKLDKRVQVILDDSVPTSYTFLAGSSDIVSPEAVAKDYDVMIVLDSSSIDRIGTLQAVIRQDKPLVNIDHHVSNTGFGTLQCIDTNAAATAEIVYQILWDLGVTFDAEMATAIYTGVATDCGFFKYANTTPRTLQIAAEMIAHGAKPNEISDAIEMRSLSALRLLARALERIEVTKDGKIAWLVIDQDLLDSAGAGQGDAEGFINYARYIQGVEVALLFREVSGRGVKVSMRSKQYVDVSAIALSFGGGGHKRAAGCSFDTGLKEAKEMVIKAISEQMAMV
jgi:phosphoesterase RecJ-like protein